MTINQANLALSNEPSKNLDRMITTNKTPLVIIPMTISFLPITYSTKIQVASGLAGGPVTKSYPIPKRMCSQLNKLDIFVPVLIILNH
jgi:hypothetical protein